VSTKSADEPCTSTFRNTNTLGRVPGSIADDVKETGGSNGRRSGSRPSPPAERVASIVELLIAHPDRRFTLSEIVDQLDLSISTAHSIMTTLTRRGWLTRRSDKTYMLGLTLAAAGRAATNAVPGLQNVEAAIDSLSAKLNVPCTASAVDGDEVVIVTRALPPGFEASVRPVGQRVPFAAPFGISYVAWGPKAEADAWLARSALRISPTERSLFQRVFDGIRERGFGIERYDRDRTRLHDALAEFRDQTLSSHLLDRIRDVLPLITVREYLPEELHELDQLDVAMVHSPVFDHDGRAHLNIAAHLSRPGLSRDEVFRAGALVMKTAQDCTNAIVAR
jgi:DNA-binding IclR family transcriptional regulator